MCANYEATLGSGSVIFSKDTAAMSGNKMMVTVRQRGGDQQGREVEFSSLKFKNGGEKNRARRDCQNHIKHQAKEKSGKKTKKAAA